MRAGGGRGQRPTRTCVGNKHVVEFVNMEALGLAKSAVSETPQKVTIDVVNLPMRPRASDAVSSTRSPMTIAAGRTMTQCTPFMATKIRPSLLIPTPVVDGPVASG